MFVSLVLRLIFPVIMFIWSLINFALPSYIYSGIVVLFSVYLIFIDMLKPTPDSSAYSEREIQIIRKYHLYIKYPSGSKIFSIVLNTFRWSAIVWVPWLYWNHSWILGSILLLNFIFLGGLSVRLDPIFFYSDAVDRGKYQFEEELDNLKALCEKIWTVKIDSEYSF